MHHPTDRISHTTAFVTPVKVKKRTLFYKTRQYNIHIFNNIFFFKTRQYNIKNFDKIFLFKYRTRHGNTIYNFSIKLSFMNIGQDKSRLQKQISKLLILNAMAA